MDNTEKYLKNIVAIGLFFVFLVLLFIIILAIGGPGRLDKIILQLFYSSSGVYARAYIWYIFRIGVLCSIGVLPVVFLVKKCKSKKVD